MLDQTKRTEDLEYHLCILLSANTLYILQIFLSRMWVGINARYFIPQRNGHYCRFQKNSNHVRNASSHQNRFAATRRLIERANLRNNATPKRLSGFVLLVGAGVILWHFQDIRHLCIASIRTARIGIVATRAVLDYKSTYSKVYPSEEERIQAISECHTRAATLTLHALLANGGVFIKLVRIPSVATL